MKKDEKESCMKYVTPQDFKDFGFIPELVGRFPVIANVEKLTRDDLVRILKEPKNAIITQYKELLGMDGINLEFSDDAYYEIAGLAYSLQTGARALRTIIETVMRDIMFDAPRMVAENNKEVMTITITADTVREKTAEKYKNVKAA
jgi:ATP-dependent Clp protease ATP-binding subunit ClpX